MMTAVGTSSYSLEGLHRVFERTTRGTKFYPLSWDQRHTAVFNLEYAPLAWLSVNMAYHYNSGFPYTLDRREYTIPNNDRMAATEQVDLRVNFTRNGEHRTKLNAFFEVTNLLDADNVLWVDSQGIAGGVLLDPSAFDLSRRIRVGVGLEI